MTFRQIINRVLRTVSEDQIDPSATELTDAYQQLVATFVNQIKEEIEDAHNWRVLWSNLPVTITGPSSVGAITGANERSRIVRVQDATLGQFVPLVFDVTTPSSPFGMTELKTAAQVYLDKTNTQSVQEPGEFTITTDAAGVPTLTVYPPPTGVRNYLVTMVVPQVELLDTDLDVNIKIPARALIMNAVYYALAERGEELGVDNVYTEERARKALDDAISRDAEEQGGLEIVPT